MWNEFFLDVERIPAFGECASATGLVASHAFQQQIAAHRSSGTVDYRRLMALKRQALEYMARRAGPELRQYLDANTQVRDYAEFRAATEKQGVAWQQWPERMRNGALEQGDYDEDKFLYHAYAQWQTRQQMESLSGTADRAGLGLYLDLPLGVHPDGYDVWRNQHLFARGVSVGAPPDDFFTRGQDWGFPPLHPDASRMQGHSHIIEVIRNSMRHAGILRLDHVMGLHRLFWIPPGYDARAGAYVRYPDEELYAIVCLESHRQQCWVIGENLGIVPTYVNDAMRKHGLGQMYVSRFQTTGDSQQAFHPVPANSVASFNTHDLPTFAAWWEGMDIQSRLDMELIDEAEADRQRADLSATRQTLIEYLSGQGFLTGEATAQSVHAACMCYLAGTPARLELLSLEDLWQETRPQNVPGTGYDHGNWQRKAVYTLEEIMGKPEIIDTLRAIDRRRKN
jgi:4-alpha-glucanotransferase